MSSKHIPKLFREDIENTNSLYRQLRDESRWKEEREFCVKMWSRFHHYADQQFTSEIARKGQFHRRLWEMYLGYTLLDIGKELNKTGEGMPDLRISDSGKNIWIEAVASGKGTEVDAVPKQQIFGLDDETEYQASSVPSEQIMLRFTKSINDKISQYKKYMEEGTVREDDPFLIALNGYDVGYDLLEQSNCPRIVRSLFGIGLPQVRFRSSDKGVEAISRGFQHQPFIKKLSGSKVSTSIFTDPDNAGISGLIYSCVAINCLRNWNLQSDPIPLGGDFLLIHNPYATNPIAQGWLKRGREFLAEINLKGRWIVHS